MPRNNRNTVKSHRKTQRSKVLHLLNSEQVYRRVMDARPEAGVFTIASAVHIALGMILAGMLFVGAILAAPSADASVVRVEKRDHQVPFARNIVVDREHVPNSVKTKVTLRDGSQWVATPCVEEDSRNCWWNACRRGNGGGTSFVNIHGQVHPVRHPCPRLRSSQSKVMDR
jgi:hypothetical protein